MAHNSKKQHALSRSMTVRSSSTKENQTLDYFS